MCLCKSPQCRETFSYDFSLGLADRKKAKEKPMYQQKLLVEQPLDDSVLGNAEKG